MRRLLVVLVLSSGCALVHERAADAAAPDDSAVHPDAGASRDAAESADSAVCAPQLAHPVRLTLTRNDELFLWRWTGLSCVEERYQTARGPNGLPVLPLVGCEGPSCGALFEEQAQCAAAYTVCGARVEVPRRGPPFSRAPTDTIACGVEICTAAEGCSFGVIPRCGSPTLGWLGSGLACDDDRDCAAGTRCCVTDNGGYVVTTCSASCDDPYVPSCLSDADCGPNAWCCQAEARMETVITSVGACTPRLCDPESHIDI